MAYGYPHVDTFNERATFEYKYSLWPRRCYTTGRWLWLTTALRGRVINESYDGIEVHKTADDRWYDSSEGLIMLIKKASK